MLVDHKISLWPSIALVVCALVPFFAIHCQEKKPEPPLKLEFRLMEPGIPGFPDVPPVLPPNSGKKENVALS